MGSKVTPRLLRRNLMTGEGESWRGSFCSILHSSGPEASPPVRVLQPLRSSRQDGKRIIPLFNSMA